MDLVYGNKAFMRKLKAVRDKRKLIVGYSDSSDEERYSDYSLSDHQEEQKKKNSKGEWSR
jgi:hypothetical protein